MVVSKINPDVNYFEINTLHENDIFKKSELYTLLFNDIHVVVSIGQENKEYEDKNIIYFPIYLIDSDKKGRPIGVYEIRANEYLEFFDNNRLNIQYFDFPLLYSFVKPEYLNKIQLKMNSEFITQNDEDSDIGSDDEKDNNVDDIYQKTSIEETKKEAQDIREKYHEKDEDDWIVKYTQNPNYELKDNYGNGDCLFLTIRDAFSTIGISRSVNQLRKMLAEDKTAEEIYKEYKTLYDEIKMSHSKDKKDFKKISEDFKNIKELAINSIDREEKNKYKEMLMNLQSQHKRLHDSIKYSKENLNEMSHMNNINSFSDFQQRIQTCEFWGDVWAITTLERILNIKTIILSSNHYENGDTMKVLQCGITNDISLSNSGIFTPDHYIMLDYTGSHYRLITYKDKAMMTYDDIPYDIKKMIIEKCMEKEEGGFNLIPEFKQFRQVNFPDENVVEANMNVNVNDNESDIVRMAGETNSDVVKKYTNQSLFTEETIFQFYSKSANDKPGKGAGVEKISKEDIISNKYAELAKMKDWRRKLSNFWEQPFMLDNNNWLSVEHYYQGSKFKNDNREFYLSFSLDSNTELSKSAAMAKEAGGKTGKFKGKLIRPKNVSIDAEFFDTRHEDEMYKAQYAKFNQNDDLKEMLLATNDAKLVHFQRGKESVVFYGLMKIRKQMMN